MKSRDLDQFYTKINIAKKYFSLLSQFLKDNKVKFSDFLEPSAGEGAFYDLMPENKIGIDLDPRVDGVIQADFLEFKLEKFDHVTLGNPPFGKNASLALRFLNKAAEHSVVVAFILPKTFKKSSMIGRVDKYLHLAYEVEVPKNSFSFNGTDYDVPCVFQIWVRKEECRIEKEKVLTHSDFYFTTREEATFAFQRIGRNAGTVKKEFASVANTSHYFIKASKRVSRILSSIDWSEVKSNTAGNPSISKRELVEQYARKVNLQ